VSAADLREKLIETLTPGDYMDGFQSAADRILAIIGEVPVVEITKSTNGPTTCKVTINGVLMFQGSDLSEGIVKAPVCAMCSRERTVGDDDHPMDAYDYNPIQAMTGRPLGWYSGDDGEVCPECMTKTIRGQ
jgi:hypothetical protein